MVQPTVQQKLQQLHGICPHRKHCEQHRSQQELAPSVQTVEQPVDKRRKQIQHNIQDDEIVLRHDAEQQRRDLEFPLSHEHFQRIGKHLEHDQLHKEHYRLFNVDPFAPVQKVTRQHNEGIDRPCPKALVQSQQRHIDSALGQCKSAVFFKPVVVQRDNAQHGEYTEQIHIRLSLICRHSIPHTGALRVLFLRISSRSQA